MREKKLESFLASRKKEASKGHEGQWKNGPILVTSYKDAKVRHWAVVPGYTYLLSLAFISIFARLETEKKGLFARAMGTQKGERRQPWFIGTKQRMEKPEMLSDREQTERERIEERVYVLGASRQQGSISEALFKLPKQN